ncbi:MAG: hypothetical protein K2X81_09030, partial [Candidatus Obscuribacterales bacterium]|nr:hypothetical protein [Candidatus Obscuribacterales bacterium]
LMQPDHVLTTTQLTAEATKFLQSVPEEQSQMKYALLLQHIAERTQNIYAMVDKKRARNSYILASSWAPLAVGAAEITGKSFDVEEDDLRSGFAMTAYSIACAFFQLKSCRSLFGESGLFSALAQSNYWHWVLVNQAARTAIRLKQFPINETVLAEALKDLQAQVPQQVLELFERRLIAAFTKERAVYSLALTAEAAEYIRPAKGFEESHKSTERLLQESVSRKELAIFVKHGLLLFRHDGEDDLKKATLVLNQTLLFDWQVVRGRTSVSVRKVPMKLGR